MEAVFKPLAVGQLQSKRMIAGGKSRLSAYQVRGWSLAPLKHFVTHSGKTIEVTRITRVPMGRVEIIKAVSAFEASRQYARSHQLSEAQWSGKASPDVVIRVSNIGEVAP